jgi:hypothetical protein
MDEAKEVTKYSHWPKQSSIDSSNRPPPVPGTRQNCPTAAPPSGASHRITDGKLHTQPLTALLDAVHAGPLGQISPRLTISSAAIDLIEQAAGVVSSHVSPLRCRRWTPCLLQRPIVRSYNSLEQPELMPTVGYLCFNPTMALATAQS